MRFLSIAELLLILEVIFLAMPGAGEAMLARVFALPVFFAAAVLPVRGLLFTAPLLLFFTAIMILLNINFVKSVFYT
jgi:hypothetical protein